MDESAIVELIQKEVVDRLPRLQRGMVCRVHTSSVRGNKGFIKLNVSGDNEIWKFVEVARANCLQANGEGWWISRAKSGACLAAQGALRQAKTALERQTGINPPPVITQDHRRRRLLVLPGDVVVARYAENAVEFNWPELEEMGYRRGKVEEAVAELRSERQWL